MTNLLTILVVLISLMLIGAILIQNPKGGGVDSTFGGAATNQMLGAARSADFIEKATWYLAAALLVLCIISSLVVGTGSEIQLLSE
jgi:preprotein translocase subunit SecG